MVKKLLLINPVDASDLNITGVSVLSFPPLSLAYLAALTPSDWDVKIIDENIEPLTLEDADLVGITAMTSAAPRAYEISRQYRERDIKTVIGGVHASMLYDEAAGFADCVVVGEAESVWRGLIEDFENRELKGVYRGERTSLQNLVKPRRDLYSDKYRFKGFMQTARGCPMDCDFCCVTAFHGGKYRQRPVEEVLDELETVNSRMLIFWDDNIIGYGKRAEERAIRLFRGMVERGLRIVWGSQASINFADNPEVMKHAQKSGCRAVLIGFESLNEDVLQGMHKVRNLAIGTGKYKEIVERLHDHGIGVIGSFIFGNDDDREDVFERTTEFVLDSKMDAAQLSILTPFPGTRLFSRLEQEERLLFTDFPDDWRYYSGADVVFRPRHMTPEQLGEGVLKAYENTTSIPRSLRRAFNSVIKTRSLQTAAFFYLWNRGYGKGYSRKYVSR